MYKSYHFVMLNMYKFPIKFLIFYNLKETNFKINNPF